MVCSSDFFPRHKHLIAKRSQRCRVWNNLLFSCCSCVWTSVKDFKAFGFFFCTFVKFNMFYFSNANTMLWSQSLILALQSTRFNFLLCKYINDANYRSSYFSFSSTERAKLSRQYLEERVNSFRNYVPQMQISKAPPFSYQKVSQTGSTLLTCDWGEIIIRQLHITGVKPQSQRWKSHLP